MIDEETYLIQQAKYQAKIEELRLANTGGGAYVEGEVETHGGDFVNGSQVKTNGESVLKQCDVSPQN